MALPLIAAGIGMFLGGAMNAIGTMKQAEAQAKAARFNADEADQDASIAEGNAELILGQARTEERKVRVMGRRVLGQIRTGFAGSGFSSSNGDAEDLLRESASAIEEDAQNIRSAGMLQAGALRQEAGKRRRYATMLREGADATLAGGVLSGIGSMFGATAQATSIFAGGRK